MMRCLKATRADFSRPRSKCSAGSSSTWPRARPRVWPRPNAQQQRPGTLGQRGQHHEAHARLSSRLPEARRPSCHGLGRVLPQRLARLTRAQDPQPRLVRCGHAVPLRLARPLVLVRQPLAHARLDVLRRQPLREVLHHPRSQRQHLAHQSEMRRGHARPVAVGQIDPLRRCMHHALQLHLALRLDAPAHHVLEKLIERVVHRPMRVLAAGQEQTNPTLHGGLTRDNFSIRVSPAPRTRRRRSGTRHLVRCTAKRSVQAATARPARHGSRGEAPVTLCHRPCNQMRARHAPTAAISLV